MYGKIKKQEIKMGKETWKEALKGYFEDVAIIEICRKDSLEKFAQFCEFIAEPAFEFLAEEFKQYKVKAKFRKLGKNAICFLIRFPGSEIKDFHYIIALPRFAVEFRPELKIRVKKGRKEKFEERNELFMENLSPQALLKLEIEDLIQDVITRFKDLTYRAIVFRR